MMMMQQQQQAPQVGMVHPQPHGMAHQVSGSSIYASGSSAVSATYSTGLERQRSYSNPRNLNLSKLHDSHFNRSSFDEFFMQLRLLQELQMPVWNSKCLCLRRPLGVTVESMAPQWPKGWEADEFAVCPHHHHRCL